MKNETQYPEAFLLRMKNILHEDYDAFIESLNGRSPTSIRFNPHKPAAIFEDEEHIPWCATGRYLRERPPFTFDPLFHAGAYYVQEASSMFIEEVWKQINPDNRDVRVLDMCAAPGGKSTHLLSLMSDDSLLVANEIIPNRNKILQQNIIKWGNANCIITQNKAVDFMKLDEYFDIVLVDAPCSGEGLFRKDKDAVNEWSENNVTMCAERQKEILRFATGCLKPGGLLIYSTCTFEPEENDKNIETLRNTKYEVRSEYKGMTPTKYGYQFFPHKVKGEGFYISVVQKDGEPERLKRPVKSSITDNQRAAITQYLRQPEDFISMQKNGLLFAIPQSIETDFLFLEQYLYIRNAGIYMGTTKGQDFLPSHDLALSNHIRKDLPAVELNYDQAIQYLRSEAPKINTDLRGWCLATYKGLNLGWMKALGNRVNNYFPKDWRILKQ